MTLGILALALAYYVAYLARGPDEHFVVVDPTHDPLLALD